MADKPRYRRNLGNRFERIPGPERKYRDRQTGKVVSKTYVYNRTERVRVRESEIQFKKKVREETVRKHRVRWFANHHNHEVWKRMGEQWEYMSFDDVENDPEFNIYNDLIRARDADVREIGYEYFRELEDEYENEDWGETP